jgi:hypothetical protein
MFFIISTIVDLFNKFQYMIVHYVCVAIGRIVEISCAHIHNVSILSSNVVREHYVEMIML